MRDEGSNDQEPDIVAVILEMVTALSPEFSHAIAHEIEQHVRKTYGGRRLFVPKTVKRMTNAERHAVFEDSLGNMSATEITKKHKISRATLYRIRQNGGRFGTK